jgi:succinoglycan biosynthesis transport protein ExoP
MSQVAVPLEERPPSLRDYLTIIRFRKWSMLTVMGMVLAAALIYSYRQTPLYESDATVVVKPVTVTAAGGYVPPPNLETEKELAESGAVANIVAKKLRIGGTGGTILGGLTVEGVINSEILIFHYIHPDRGEAQRRAQAFAESYLQYRRDQALDDLLASSQALEQRIGALTQDLEDVKDEISVTRDETEKTALEAQSSSLISQIAILQTRLTDLAPSEDLRVGQVVQDAPRPSSPVYPDHTKNAIFGLFLGSLAGVSVAFLREHLDDRLRGREDLAAELGAPVLSVLPHVAEWRKRHEERLVTLSEQHSPVSEAYRMLRTGVLFGASQWSAKTIMVASARAGEGKSFTVANLGVALAQAGKRTILVSADLRRPRLHMFFNAPMDYGLTDVLADHGAPLSMLTSTRIDNLIFLSSGPVPGSPAELLGSDAMQKLLLELRDAADFVLIDSTPVLAVADALILAPMADAVLFVADADATPRSAVRHARQELEQVNARVMGAVLNNFNPSKASHYAPYYSYSYGGRRQNGLRSRLPQGRAGDESRR